MSERVSPSRQLRSLQGRRVRLALTDGTSIDDAQLISAGRGVPTVWLVTDGIDMFLPVAEIVEASEKLAA